MIDPQPDFKRVQVALRCETPDRVPLGDTAIHTSVMEAVIGRPVRDLADRVEFFYLSGFDFVPVTLDLQDMNTGAHEAGAGSLSAEARWAQEGRGAIGDWADLEGHRFPTVDEMNLTEFVETRNLLRQGMDIIAQAGHIFTDVWRLMGFESFSLALHDDPDLVAAVFKKVGDLVVEATARLLDTVKIGALKSADDIAYTEGLMVGPDVLRRHLLPYIRQLVQLAHAHDVPFIYHSDGDITAVLDDLMDCGIDALNPIEPKAMDIVELKRRYGGRLCLIGNIDLSYTLTRGSPADVEAEVRDRILAVGPGGGYVVASANSIPFYVPAANFVAMVDATFKWGSYPIGSGT